MMAHQIQIEIERKYDVDAGTEAPRLIGVGAVAAESAPEVIELTAVYFDTAALDLARNSTALRRREGGADAGWHIKLAAAEGRTELLWPPTDSTTVPNEVIEPVADLVGDAALVPLARVTNTRTTTILLDAAGFAVAELCDDQVRSENLRAGGVRAWREWEVELLGGAPDTREEREALLDEVEQRLIETGARPSTSSSKLARALGLDDLG
jgi:inorganic triphosphatase YgiF